MKEKILFWLNKLEKIEKSAQLYVETSSPESLIIRKHKNTQQYYVNGKYVSKSEKTLISKLAEKNYNKEVLDQTRKQKNATIRFIKECNFDYLKEIYSSLSEETTSLIKNFYDVSDEEFSRIWQNTPYLKNNYPFGEKSFFSSKGEQMRSKSELIIANTLAALGIPYKYECALRSQKHGLIFPDFTALNKHTRDVLYIEHFGMMDNDEYRSKQFFKKLQVYSSLGICPGKNLIMLFEDRWHPLNTDILNLTLKEYFR